jgi:hypothetical protein
MIYACIELACAISQFLKTGFGLSPLFSLLSSSCSAAIFESPTCGFLVFELAFLKPRCCIYCARPHMRIVTHPHIYPPNSVPSTSNDLALMARSSTSSHQSLLITPRRSPRQSVSHQSLSPRRSPRQATLHHFVAPRYALSYRHFSTLLTIF